MDLETATVNRSHGYQFGEEGVQLTDQPIDTVTLACHFHSSLDTTASETRHDTDGSWIWRPQQSIAAKSIGLDRNKVCKPTDQPIDTETFTCLFSKSPDTTASETTVAKNGSWTWKLQQ
ncbi:MAG: hypothetical protein J3Q66DRAFT_369491 [Benniella sp.]|nr:MAG: hypothetical protein J3Q66DRAFT_369491 [Benniella sp.]